MNIGSALHPTPLRDGRLMFSTLESQGLRDGRMWGIWSIWPDGRHWEPVVSAFRDGQAFHFMTQLSNDDLVVVDYYNLNNNGFGAFYRLPRGAAGRHAGLLLGVPAGQSAHRSKRSAAASPTRSPCRSRPMACTRSRRSRTATTRPRRSAPAARGSASSPTPAAAPNNDLLVVWSPGPCNDLNRPTTLPYYDSGLYLIRGGNPVNAPSELVLMKNNPNYNEAWPRAVVPYARRARRRRAGACCRGCRTTARSTPLLPAGTPYGLVGTSSLYKRESFPGLVTSWSDTFDGLDAFNTLENGQSSNWFTQGADAGRYANSDIWAMRIVGMEPNTHRSYGPNGGPSGGQRFFSHAMEKLRILGEIPLRKSDVRRRPMLDPEGNPDTSFLVKLPADSPFTFQTLDRNGMVLNVAQTWHQVRPGEVRTDCGGCHAHSQQPLDFAATAAARPGYDRARPQCGDAAADARCAGPTGAARRSRRRWSRSSSCATSARCCSAAASPAIASANPPGNLRLDDTAILTDGLPGRLRASGRRRRASAGAIRR